MSKSILVIDTPNSCSECPCRNKDECGNQHKGFIGDYLGLKGYKPSWCPLRPLPKKKNTDFHPNIVYANGYNACIDEIIGEENG